MTATGRARRSFDGSTVAIATSVMNVATYGFTIVAARLTGPDEYGAFIACLNLLVVIQVIALGLQATAARRIASGADHVASVERSILTLSLRLSLGLGVVLLVLVPGVKSLLQLDHLGTAVVVALAAVPLTFAGGQAGILQGERRWGALSLMYVAAGVPRLVVGTVLVALEPSATAAVIGVGIGYLFPVLVGSWALRHRRPSGPPDTEHTLVSVLRESVYSSQALFAYFALTSVDIIVARHVLPDHDAGLYAAGLIMTKAMLFLPQFVVILAFPDMASTQGRQRALFVSMLLVSALGAVAAVVTWWLSDLAMVFVGGSDFAEIQDRLWVFAVLGTALSLIQLQVYAVLARRGRRSVLLVWAALVAVVAAGLGTTSVSGLVTAVLTVDLVLVVLLTAVSLHLARRPAPPPVVVP
jgi:O-antigen/teichoic acid export membrane protein